MIQDDLSEFSPDIAGLKNISRMFDNTPVIIVITDRLGVVEYVNSGFTRVTGFTQEETRGRKINLIKSGYHDDGFYREMWQTLLSGKIWEGEIRNRRKNGNLYWESATISPILSQDGGVIQFLKVSNDITENRKLTDMLVRSRDFIQRVMETAGAMAVLDREYTIIRGNDRLASLAGFPGEDLAGRDFLSLIEPEHKEKLRSEIDQIISSHEGSATVEHVILRGENGRRIIQMTMNSFVQDGKVTGLVIILDDVTEMRRADRERKVILKAITESPASVVITDVTGSITYVNPKFTEVTGYGTEEVMGENPSILKSGMQEREFYRELWKTILSGKEWRGEFHNRRKNGELYWEQASISPIMTDGGEISHFVAVKEDITESKRNEIALRESEKQLRNHNERMLQDLRQAREIIDRLYPMDVPVMPGISVTTRFIPMEMVGGDFYTWYSGEPGVITFLMGDVAGHGVPAALFLSLVRSISDRLMPVLGKHPARLLDSLNRELIGSLSSYFLTAVALTIEIRKDRSGARISLASGGHPPVLLARKSSASMEDLNPPGKLLGVVADIGFEEESNELLPGDRIYLYTDGLIEVMNREKQLINLEGVRSIIMDGGGVTLDESIDNLLVSLDRYREGAPYGDDLLLIGIEIDKGTDYVE